MKRKILLLLILLMLLFVSCSKTKQAETPTEKSTEIQILWAYIKMPNGKIIEVETNGHNSRSSSGYTIFGIDGTVYYTGGENVVVTNRRISL